MKKLTKVFIGGLFQPLHNISESDWKRLCTRPRRHYTFLYGLKTGLMTGHDATCLVTLVFYTAGTQHSCIDHHGEGGHQYLGHRRVRCGRPAVADLGKTTSGMNRMRLQQCQIQSSCLFSDYDSRKQLMLRESESSLLAQRLENPLRSSPWGPTSRSFLRGAGGEGWSPDPAWMTRSCRGVQNLRFVLIFIMPPWNNTKYIANRRHIELRCDRICCRWKIRPLSVLNNKNNIAQDPVLGSLDLCQWKRKVSIKYLNYNDTHQIFLGTACCDYDSSNWKFQTPTKQILGSMLGQDRL